jgi:uncharacterized phiE125 gp8 family phage protein
MALTLHTAPSEEPVTLAEAKMHCRITSSTEDALISAWIIAARGRAENYTGRRVITQTWDWSMDAFPCGVVEVPNAPLQSVTEITYTDGAGIEQTLDPAAYQVDAKSDPGRIAPAAGGTWVVASSNTLNAVTVRFVCGYGLAVDVPNEIRAAMLLHISELNEHREAMLEVQTYATRAWEALLLPFCIPRL